ncbi:MAG: DUF5804 family protein [Methanomicrobiales archaeon]|nr:DUF5804 family protein [Methanomicrobiales archaeon]
MRVMFIQKEGVPLHHTLIASETSRRALRFYQPEKKTWGVEISVTSLGSALSLVSELRWYIRRYMTAVLFELSPGIFCTHALSREVHYQRDVKLTEAWEWRKMYVIRGERVASIEPMDPGSIITDFTDKFGPADMSLEVWCTEEEIGEALGDEGDRPGSEPPGIEDNTARL